MVSADMLTPRRPVEVKTLAAVSRLLASPRMRLPLTVSHYEEEAAES